VEENVFTEVHQVKAGDFASAGEASSHFKRVLKQLGIDGDLVRRASIMSYEAELNLVIHSEGGELKLEVSPEHVRIISEDVGPGIEDIDLAMTAGYSTAPDSVRMMGFGAGMGLCNMERCADDFQISSSKAGTKISMTMNL
jgi:serine/threonine-protein kinase RsbT